MEFGFAQWNICKYVCKYEIHIESRDSMILALTWVRIFMCYQPDIARWFCQMYSCAESLCQKILIVQGQCCIFDDDAIAILDSKSRKKPLVVNGNVLGGLNVRSPNPVNSVHTGWFEKRNKRSLALGLCYEAGIKHPVQTRCFIGLITVKGKLFATKISDLILEAFPAGFCHSLSKRAINQMIS